MKSIINNFMIGFLVTLLLFSPFLMGLSIYLNQNGIETFILGTEKFYAYSFISSDQGFEVLFGPGIIVIGILGGLLSVIVYMVSKKLFHSSLNN